jgi:hypothetical protein
MQHSFECAAQLFSHAPTGGIIYGSLQFNSFKTEIFKSHVPNELCGFSSKTPTSAAALNPKSQACTLMFYQQITQAAAAQELSCDTVLDSEIVSGFTRPCLAPPIDIFRSFIPCVSGMAPRLVT